MCYEAFDRAGASELQPGTWARGARPWIGGWICTGGGDLEIAERVQARWPEGPPWDATLLTWLGDDYTRLVRRWRRGLRSLMP